MESCLSSNCETAVAGVAWVRVGEGERDGAGEADGELQSEGTRPWIEATDDLRLCLLLSGTEWVRRWVREKKPKVS